MTYETIVSIVIGVVYVIILVPSFIYIANYINNEHQEEMRLAFLEKRSYKKMFDGLQEGIVVL